jgi:hypothetical protein
LIIEIESLGTIFAQMQTAARDDIVDIDDIKKLNTVTEKMFNDLHHMVERFKEQKGKE